MNGCYQFGSLIENRVLYGVRFFLRNVIEITRNVVFFVGGACLRDFNTHLVIIILNGGLFFFTQTYLIIFAFGIVLA